MDPEKLLISQYLANSRSRTKPKSQATTARASRYHYQANQSRDGAVNVHVLNDSYRNASVRASTHGGMNFKPLSRDGVQITSAEERQRLMIEPWYIQQKKSMQSARQSKPESKES